MGTHDDVARDAGGPVSEVCIVGAGITGLNALVVASTYLSRSDKVVLVDRRSRAGGMWVDTYDYVRLHQPHGIFTAGNVKWTLGEPPSHLATKPEVLAHLHHCVGVARERVDLEEHYGWDYVAHEEVDGLVHVTFRAADGSARTVKTQRLIKAFGHVVAPNEPLATSSERVRSTTPERLDLDSPEVRGDDAPFWIIGSGKTAMDAAHLVITRLPGREVHMLAGPGTMFSRRDSFFPTGASRWWSGTRINTMLGEVGERFDGTNEDEVREWYRTAYGIGLSRDAKNFFGAYLSEAELEVITAGLRSAEHEYFADAVDRGEAVDLVLRSGGTRTVPPGTWLVNCTGSLLRTSHPYEPFVSPSGRTLSIQMRSSTTGIFSAFAGYYLTHLMFTGRLGSVGLYELDVEELHQKARHVVTFASLSLSVHNLSLLSEALPKKALMECGLDYDLWYPLPRRLVGVADFLRTHRRRREQCRQALDTLGERFDVRAGPLPAGATTGENTF